MNALGLEASPGKSAIAKGLWPLVMPVAVTRRPRRTAFLVSGIRSTITMTPNHATSLPVYDEWIQGSL